MERKSFSISPASHISSVVWSHGCPCPSSFRACGFLLMINHDLSLTHTNHFLWVSRDMALQPWPPTCPALSEVTGSLRANRSLQHLLIPVLGQTTPAPPCFLPYSQPWCSNLNTESPFDPTSLLFIPLVKFTYTSAFSLFFTPSLPQSSI